MFFYFVSIFVRVHAQAKRSAANIVNKIPNVRVFDMKTAVRDMQMSRPPVAKVECRLTSVMAGFLVGGLELAPRSSASSVTFLCSELLELMSAAL